MDDLLIGGYYGDIHYFQRIDDTFVADHILDSTPQSFKLFQNYPNPFNSTTSIGYYLPKAGKVNISIYNSLGQKVRILGNGYRQAGSHTVQWDSKDEHGISLSSGLYICYLQTYGYSHLIKLMLLK